MVSYRREAEARREKANLRSKAGTSYREQSGEFPYCFTYLVRGKAAGAKALN
jgi:hypothetical protein